MVLRLTERSSKQRLNKTVLLRPASGFVLRKEKTFVSLELRLGRPYLASLRLSLTSLLNLLSLLSLLNVLSLLT